jgi:hypothetical protein
MSTKTLLDRLVPRASSGWSRSTGNRSLLKIIEQGQDALVGALGEKRIWRGSDNAGFPPYLQTTAGTYIYEVKAANLSCDAIALLINGTSYTVIPDLVKRIFIDVTLAGYNTGISWLGQPALYADLNPYANLNERLMVSQVFCETLPAMGPGYPVVTFPFDPGTETAKYFCEFYWRAPRLDSETIPLIVPPEFERALEEYVIGYMQECENGSPSDFTEKFDTYWKPEFVRKFSSAGKIRNNSVILRPC